jgi:hypothetical protein
MTSRDDGLAGLEVARAAFFDAYKGVPPEALSYLKPGDDYCLGGIVIHVSVVLEHYGRILSELLDAAHGEIQGQETPEFWQSMGERSKSGPAPGEEGEVFAEVDRRHDGIIAGATSLSDEEWGRKAPVFFAPEEPLPTSPADVVGWLRDHYYEHVPQIRELFLEWRAHSIH